MSDQPSPRSADSTLALSAQVCASCGRPRLTSGDAGCCGGIGRMPSSTTTCATSFHMIQDPISERDASLPLGRKTSGMGVLTSSAEASHAKTSASRASAPDSPASAADCSSSSLGSQMSFDHVGSSLRTSLGSSPLPTAETLESFSQRWPTSGMASRGEWLTLDSSEFPSGAVECSLSDVLEATVSERYSLSARAARGILRRAGARGRALPQDLEAALRSLSDATPAEPDKRTTPITS